jgi:Helix-turn-helix domain
LNKKKHPTWEQVGKQIKSILPILCHNNLKIKIMTMEVITKEDLNEFRKLLMNDIKEIIQGKAQKQWLKSNEVRKLLNISPGTLQNMRINGTLSYTKIGGIIYYSYNDIDKVLEVNKVNAHSNLFK